MEEPKDIFSYINSKKTEVPSELYFNALAERIIQEQKSNLKVIPLYKKPFFKWAIAASIILPLAIYFLSQNSTYDTKNEPVLLGMNDITKEDIHTYIMENIEEFNLNEISEMIPEEVIKSFDAKPVTLTTTTTSDFFEELSSDEIKSYFESQEIDLEELEDEIFI